MPSMGSYTLIKNEAPWVAAHILAWLPHLGSMTFFDGNSTDGTIEIIEAIKAEHDAYNKINLVKNQDPIDLKDDYVRVFNKCLAAVPSDMAFFAHPDMYPVKVPENFNHLKDALAASVSMRTFAGEPDGQLYEIKGRGQRWKSIDRLRNPDLGAVYHGHYGAWNEGVYPTEIVGDSRRLHPSLERYPYKIEDSGIEILHFSDVRHYERRLGRMKACMKNQDNPAAPDAERHPRVTLKDGLDFVGKPYEFTPAEYPAEMLAAREEYRHLEKQLAHV